MTDTKDRILDAAEKLIAEQGYASTSLRQIIAEAGVNLASVHYHFGSKEELLDGLISRKIGPVNQRRLAMLTDYEDRAAPEAAQLEELLTAFLAPAFVMGLKGKAFLKVMGRLHSEGLMPVLVEKHFHEVIRRFFAAFEKALPHLSQDELRWRVHMMVGAMAHTMWHQPTSPQRPGTADAPECPELLVKRLVAFFGPAFRAPEVAVSESEVKQ
jgi:AcrR family transcriptional regulator